jgi:hypothetical protein
MADQRQADQHPYRDSYPEMNPYIKTHSGLQTSPGLNQLLLRELHMDPMNPDIAHLLAIRMSLDQERIQPCILLLCRPAETRPKKMIAHAFRGKPKLDQFFGLRNHFRRKTQPFPAEIRFPSPVGVSGRSGNGDWQHRFQQLQ